MVYVFKMSEIRVTDDATAPLCPFVSYISIAEIAP